MIKPNITPIKFITTLAVAGVISAGLILLIDYKSLTIELDFQESFIILSLLAMLYKSQILNKSSKIDCTTGLLTRDAFIEKCSLILENAADTNYKYHLMILDLNKFKQINNTAGHGVGDKLLRTISDKVLALTQKDDLVSRFGTDEIAIFLTDIRRSDIYKSLANDIISALSTPVNIDNHRLYATPSIGVASYPDSGSTFLELIRCADIAMASSRKLQKDYSVYNVNADTNSITRLTLDAELKTAITDGDLVLFFQPKKNLATGEILAVESLVRWKHPVKGLIMPDQFIPGAEESGIIKYVTQFVIKEAAHAYGILKEAGYDLKVAVNVSSNDIVDPEMLTTIIKSIVKSDMEPAKFILEVTETAIMHETDAALNVLLALSSLGIQVSIDDFGTGHSSLVYLKNFPINEVKLDRSFITDINISKEGYSIVKSTVELTHSLSATTVAEGVETKEIEDILRDLGCDEIQGYYLARPMPINDLITWLHNYQNEQTK